MYLPVLTISFLVHCYSITYMKSDPHNPRFFSYLSLFTFFMLLLVSGDNYLILFIGWEGVGIMSFLLISFWYTRVQAVKSAMSAILYNRVGDLFFILGMAILLASVGSLKFSIVFSVVPSLNKTVLFLVGVCFLLAATGKSAQLGLHIWLPQAMEGPTPVSALIHAATMVTAGVYLLLRSSPLLEFNSYVLYLISGLGALTALVSGCIGLFQNDLKRIIAYSTCSQLGMMFVSIGLSKYSLALFHLINHAFFKALLFLSAGVIIHAFNDEQDLRRMGGLRPGMPLTYLFVLIGSMSLMAMPFLTGYYSKDVILEMSFERIEFYCLLVFVSVLTSSYSFKIIYYVFLSFPNGGHPKTYEKVHDVPSGMFLPLFFLSLCSIFGGYFTRELFIGIGSSALGNSLFTARESFIEFEIPVFFKILPMLLSILTVIVLFIIYHWNPWISSRGNLYRMFNQRMWLDLLFAKILQRVLSIGYYTSKYLDKGVLEYIGPWGFYKFFTYLTQSLSRADTHILRHYLIYMCLGLWGVILIVYSNIDYSIILIMLMSTLLIFTS
uniref:NADH-ubiquinone oxidoreductase chain 5 n=1 Tax=Pneumocystis murina (strain B123) TaxID=1069680 RepID=M1FKB0_PNEMU|nr:NADH dehydrogenase subunit 5 [Pneumocystis murina]AFR90413.1 NADH dehydrogenase subunit 5 [Pneumocystis murina]